MIKLQIKWWKIDDWKRDDWIGVWNHDKKAKNDIPIKRIPVNNSKGSQLLNIEWNKKITGLQFTRNLSKIQNCLPLRAGYYRNEHELLFSSCLRIYPFWMQKLQKNIYNKSLANLFLPGATEETYDSQILGLKSSPWYDLLNGARYLKTSVIFQEKFPRKYFVLWGDRKLTLIRFLNNIYYFLKQTKEIVIVEIHLLTEDPNVHQDVKNIIMTLFYGMLITREEGNSLQIEDLWKANKRILIACPQISASKYIWQEIESVTYTIGRSEAIEMNIYGQSIVWVLNIRDNEANASNSSNSIKFHDMIDTFFLPRLKSDIWKKLNIVTLPCLACTNIARLAIEANHEKKKCPEFEKVLRLLRVLEGERTGGDLPWHLKECNEDKANPSRILVWPTVKAREERINQKTIPRLIQINWEAKEVFPDDLVAVFKELPKVGSVTEIPIINLNYRLKNDTLEGFNVVYWTDTDLLPLLANKSESGASSLVPLFAARPYSTEGIITTTLSHPRPTTSTLAKGGCVGFSVAFVRRGIIVAARCISSYPKWMWDNRSSLANVPLRSLLIPGTHNSGSYSINDNSDPVNDWIICQDDTVLTQLLLGTRYLDLRVGYYPETRELLWINHDLIKWLPLHDVLNDIKAFAFISPDPIIVDIHRTPVGFKEKEAAWLLISLINSSLGEYLAPSSLKADVTPEDMWRIGKTVILSYGTHRIRSNVPWLWPPIFQAWANAQLLDDLRRYLDEEMEKQPKTRKLWAAMGQLTPSYWDIIINFGSSGVRKLADKTGRLLTTWLKERWRNKANILTSDFLQTNDVIFTSIRLNILRKKCPEMLELYHATEGPTTSTIFSLAAGDPLYDYKNTVTVTSSDT